MDLAGLYCIFCSDLGYVNIGQLKNLNVSNIMLAFKQSN